MKIPTRLDDAGVAAPLPLTGSEIHLPDLWRAAWRAKWWIFLTPVVLMVVVGVWTMLQEPEYEATATLLVEEEGAPGGMLAQQVAAFAGLGTPRSTLETDLKLLESRQIAEQVVDSLSLQVRLEEPLVPRSELFEEVSAEREAFAGLIRLERRPNGRYGVSVEPANPATAGSLHVPESVGYGERLDIDGIRLRLKEPDLEEVPNTIELRILTFRSAVESFLGQLGVERVGGSVVGVKMRHTDPELAAAAANGVVDNFIAYRLLSNRSNARGAIDFLRDQVEHYEVQLRQAEDRLREFRERESVVAPEQAASSQAQRLSALDAQRAELIAERDVLAQLIREAEASAGTQGSAGYRKLAAFPEFFRNPAVQNILSSLVALENERSQLLVKRTTENVDVRGLTNRIQDLEQQLYLTATNYLAGLEEQIAAVDRTLGQSVGRASEIPRVQTEFVRLTREVELLDEIYTLLQTRLKEQEVSEADARSDIRPLDVALVPLSPVSPRPKLNLLLALMVGLMLGVGIAAVKAIFDPAMYSKEVAVAAAGGVPILTSIPEMRPAGLRLLPAGPAALLRRASGNALAASNGQRAKGRGNGIVVDAEVAEAYADLRTRLAMFTAPPPRVVVVTSPREGDGKSTVAANLALAYARHGTRTLLLEGDLRRGRLARQLGLDSSGPGFGQVLHGSATAAKALRQRPIEDGTGKLLDVLLAGSAPRHPTELLDSPALARLLGELRERYEMIVIDTPPLDAVADALLLARLADGALLVTRAGSTDRNALEDAVAELNAVGTLVHGLVLNGFADRHAAHYAYERSR